MRTRILALPLALTVAFAVFMPSFWMIDVFQSQTPAAMIVSSTDMLPTAASQDSAPLSVADEGNDNMDPFTPLAPPHNSLTSTESSTARLLLPPHLHPVQEEFSLHHSLPPSISQEVPTTPPLHQA